MLGVWEREWVCCRQTTCCPRVKAVNAIATQPGNHACHIRQPPPGLGRCNSERQCQPATRESACMVSDAQISSYYFQGKIFGLEGATPASARLRWPNMVPATPARTQSTSPRRMLSRPQAAAARLRRRCETPISQWTRAGQRCGPSAGLDSNRRLIGSPVTQRTRQNLPNIVGKTWQPQRQREVIRSCARQCMCAADPALQRFKE